MSDNMRKNMDEISALFEADEHLWIDSQISALESGDMERVDRPHLIDYLNEMAGRDRRELEHRFEILVAHMLKIMVQPEKYTKSWFLTIRDQQTRISKLIKHLPSMATFMDQLFKDAYSSAVRNASDETGISIEKFPIKCPWTARETLTYLPLESPLPKKRKTQKEK